MPTCGNCKKSVAGSDVTCPHCGVLLAAYASPAGSGAGGTYEAPPPPPVAEIPSVEMDVKPPSEADIVTDPTEITEEPISTAPRPLFDTYLTVEEIAKAAEGDHEEDVVTISEQKIATKPIEFETPDYARPPSDAAPIPTIDEDDASIPLITRDDAPPAHETSGPEIKQRVDPPPTTEEWLSAPAPRMRPNPKARAVARPAADSEPVGTTDEYLRKLHHDASYVSSEPALSRPVEQRRPTPAERNRNRRSGKTWTPTQQQAASEQSTATGASTLHIMVLAILWFSTMFTILSGSFNTVLVFVTIAATWGFTPVRKFIDDMREM